MIKAGFHLIDVISTEDEINVTRLKPCRTYTASGRKRQNSM